ncbi:MAG: T9SS type A sorting domain-containing protein [Flavobacteriales bacterium]|nr:T9SS type A sorting domain-containing protein [Flavobacteriales bacterium]MCB9204721.1 T9SS type A sorting domain-containing protein [Flavobacteriales bacterium]
MRALFGFLFLLFSAVSVGQNYQPININSLQVFYQETPYPTPYNWEEIANMWGTRIDSIDIHSNGDTIYYNYSIARDTAAENGNFNSIWWISPNWNGTATRVESSGTSWFYQYSGDSVRIEHSAPLYQEWLAYSSQAGDSLVGKVTEIGWADDNWIADSVKTLAFTKYFNGALVWSGAKLELYKNNGIRKTVDFEKFPNDTTPVFRIDPNTINRYSPGYSANGKIRPAPTIGDGFYHIASCESYGVPCYGINGPSSESVLDVSVDSTSGQITATILRNTYYSGLQSSTSDIIYEPLPDTFGPIYWALYNEDLMPRENESIYAYGQSNLINTNDSCFYPTVTIHAPPSECLGEEYRFAPYIGFVYNYWNQDDSYCGWFAYYYRYYTFLRLGGVECGQPLMVGIDETFEVSLNLYPNPATETVQIQLKQQEDFEVLVTDVLGRTVCNEVPRSAQKSTMELDVSGWPNGVYLVSVFNQKGVRSTQRLVVQH